MSQYLAWGQYFCFFCFFWVSRGKTPPPKKKGRTYVPVSGMGSKKKQKGRTYVPVSGMGSVLLFFGFLEVKQKKQKGRTYVPVSGMGSVLLFFLFFWFFAVKPKKAKKKAEPMSQHLAWGHYFCFFGFSRFSQYSGI